NHARQRELSQSVGCRYEERDHEDGLRSRRGGHLRAGSALISSRQLDQEPARSAVRNSHKRCGRMVAMNTTTVSAAQPVLANLDRLLPDLETLYKDVHSHPELSMQETRTAGLAAERLRIAGYEVTDRK